MDVFTRGSSLPLWCRSGSGVRHDCGAAQTEAAVKAPVIGAQTSQRPADGGEMSRVHPEGLGRTERFHSAGTKMTCHTLKCVESVPRRAQAIRRREDGITDGDVHRIASFSWGTRVNWEVACT